MEPPLTVVLFASAPEVGYWEWSQQRDGQQDVSVLRRGYAHAQNSQQRNHKLCDGGESHARRLCCFCHTDALKLCGYIFSYVPTWFLSHTNII